MNINTYNLILNEETRHTSLQLKESFSYQRETFGSAQYIHSMMVDLFQLDKLADEFVYLIAFNTKMRVLGLFEISHGTANASLLDARGVFMRAVYTGASHIVLVHNHPSGDATPSRDDTLISKRMKEAGELMGILLEDHIIIGSNCYFSFHEQGML